MSDRPLKVIVSADGSHQYIPLSDDEIAEREAMRLQAEADQAAREAEATRIAALKESAKAKLVAGTKLTPEEASLLIG